jgi:hypothetical protein
VKVIARTLRVSRSNLLDRLPYAQASGARGAEREAPARSKAASSASPSPTSLADAPLVSRVQTLVGERPSYGYRRVTAMLNRQAEPPGQASGQP